MVFFIVKTIKPVHVLQFVYWQNAKTRRDADLPKASAKRACLEAKQTQLYAKSVWQEHYWALGFTTFSKPIFEKSKKKERKQREIRKSRKYTENLRHLQIVASAKREEGKRWGGEEIRNRSCDRKYSQVYHNFPSSRLLPAFFFVIYVSFHTFRIYTRYLSFGLFI